MANDREKLRGETEFLGKDTQTRHQHGPSIDQSSTVTYDRVAVSVFRRACSTLRFDSQLDSTRSLQAADSSLSRGKTSTIVLLWRSGVFH